MTTVSTSFVDIRSSPERVWAALTEPSLVKRWQYDSELVTDWSVGGPIRFVAGWEGQSFEQWGTVREFDAPVTLSYSLFAPRPGLANVPQNSFTMTYRLESLGGAGGVTRLYVTQSDPRPADGSSGDGDGRGNADRDDAVFRGDEDGSENPVFAALKALCEQ